MRTFFYAVLFKKNFNGGGAFHVEMNGTNVTGTISIGNTGGWQNWTNLMKTVKLNAGTHVMKIFIEAGDINLNKYTFTQIITGLDAEKGNGVNGVSFFPNPASSFIRLTSNVEGKSLVTIADMHGGTIIKETIDENGPLDVSSLSPGIYIITIKTGQSVKTTQLVIER